MTGKARRRRLIFIGMMTVGGMVLGMIIAALAVTVAERSPAIKILAQDDAGQIALNDGRIMIYTKVDRLRSCRIETSHWLFTNVAHDAETVRTYIPIPGDGAVPVRGLGQNSYILSVPLPSGLWPAKWYWLESRAEECGLLGWMLPIYSESAPIEIDVERTRAVFGKPVTTVRDGKTIVRSNSPIVPPPTGVAR